MSNISPLGWVAIIFLIIFIMTLNLWLFSAGKNLNQNKNSSANILRKTTKLLQNPFAEENNQLEELAMLTSALKNDQSQAKDVSEEK